MGETVPSKHAGRRQLQQIIAGLTEGVILVDPDQSISWANQAALAMHGIERLDELGDNVTEYRTRFELRYRNNHRLPQGAYPMDRVLAGEAFTDVTVAVARAGDEEPQWVHRIRSLVLTDDEGKPDCLVLVLHDLTDEISAEERFEQAFNANPAPAIICRLSDLRYVKVNKGFQEMTGYTRETVIGRSVYEIDVLEDVEKKELAVERLNEGRTIPQMEAQLKLPDGSKKFVIIAGQPIKIGDEACMLFTFMDLEPRKKAESALLQSEERFSKTFRLAPVPILISTMEGFKTLDINDAFMAMTGYPAEEVIGRSTADIQLWGNSASRKQIEQALEKTGSVRNLEVGVQTKGGELVDCLVSVDTLSIQNQACILTVMQDITERKRSETELVAAIETVMQDTSWFSQTIVEKIAELRHPQRPNKPMIGLKDFTAREREVLGLICRGRSNEDIANHLGISHNTVRNQLTAIYGKAGVNRRSNLIVWARERGVTGEEPTQRTGKTAGKGR